MGSKQEIRSFHVTVVYADGTEELLCGGMALADLSITTHFAENDPEDGFATRFPVARTITIEEVFDRGQVNA